MPLASRLAIGGGALFGAYLGGKALSKHGDQETSTSDRAVSGGVVGALGGGLAVGLGLMGIKSGMLPKAWASSSKYATKSFTAAKEAYGGFRAQHGVWTSLEKAVGQRALAVGIGSTAGLVIGEENDRPLQGLAYGAAAGFGFDTIRRGHSIWKAPTKWTSKTAGKIAQGGMIVAVAGAAGAAGIATAPSHAPVQQAGVYDETGEVNYVSPEEMEASGPGQRMRQINATGGMVFGLHNKRH